MQITINDFIDISSIISDLETINFLDIIEACQHLDEFQKDCFELNNSNIFKVSIYVDSHIDNLNINFENERAIQIEIFSKNIILGFAINNLDIHATSVEVFNLNIGRFNCNYEMLNLSNSKVDSAFLENKLVRTLSEENFEFRTDISNVKFNFLSIESEENKSELFIDNSSIFDSFILEGVISEISLFDLRINKMVFNDILMNDIFLSRSQVGSVYHLSRDKVKNYSDSYRNLHIISAEESENHEEYIKLRIEKNRDIGRKSNSYWVKVGYLLMEKICGYGFYPGRVIAYSVIVIFLFTVFYTILDMNRYGLEKVLELKNIWVHGLINNIYLSMMAFTTTGFGDVSPFGDVEKILTGLESIFGIALMAIFIYSLTKRFELFNKNK